MQIFLQGNKSQIELARPIRQEGKRFFAVNLKVLANNFATLKKLIKENSITEEFIYNLDDVCATYVKDFEPNTLSKRVMTRKRQFDTEMIEWSYHHRIIMMPVVSGIVECAPQLFVFKDSIPY